jgi:carbon-monoxide dehydrogenase medium subunit
MSNSRVITSEFHYYAPATLNDALKLMKEQGARPLAGGTDLLNTIKTEGMAPKALIYTMNIDSLEVLSAEKGLTIGAAARLADIEALPAVRKRYPALRESINVIGGTQIRNMATLAGNLCNASPGADTPPVLIVLHAEVELSRIEDGGSVAARRLPVEELFSGPKKTVLRPDELLTSIYVPEPAAGSGQSFRRLARVKLDIAKINCAVALRREGDTIKEIRIAFGSVAPTPVRAARTEALLEGKAYSGELLETAAGTIGSDIAPIDDIRSSAEYRNHTAGILLQEAVDEAWQRAGGN